MWVDYNVNDMVRIKITKTGHDTLEKQHRDLCSQYGIKHKYPIPVVDTEGFTEMPLWTVMQRFGDQMFNGNPDVPFDTVIKFKVNELELKPEIDKRTHHPKRKQYITMDDQAFNDLVNKNIPAFNGDYEAVPCNEWNNDSSYSFNDIGIAPDYMKTYDYPRIEAGYTTSPNARELLTYLCEKKVIEPGNYLITVSW